MLTNEKFTQEVGHDTIKSMKSSYIQLLKRLR